MPTLFQEIEVYLQVNGNSKEIQNFSTIKQLISDGEYNKVEMKMSNWSDRGGSSCFHSKPTVYRTKLAACLNQLQQYSSEEEKIEYLKREFNSVNPESKIVVYAIVGAESEVDFQENFYAKLKTNQLSLLHKEKAANRALREFKKENQKLFCVMVRLNVPLFYVDACGKQIYKWFNHPKLVDSQIEGYYTLSRNGKIQSYFKDEVDACLQVATPRSGRQ